MSHRTTPAARRPAPVLGAVLAGGRSTRFGSDKALAVLQGRSLIDHAIAALGPHVGSVVVCGREVVNAICLADRPRPDMGPLGGLNAALQYAIEHGYGGVLSLGCDMPTLPDGVAGALIADEATIVEGQHLVGYWPIGLAAGLAEHMLVSENRSIRCWLDKVQPKSIGLAGSPLPNINTPEDLETLRQNWPRC